MSLEARIELLTAAVIELTAAIGSMQAPLIGSMQAPLSPLDVLKENAQFRVRQDAETQEAQFRARQDAEAQEASEGAKKSAAKSTDTTSGEQSVPTGESSSPALDYDKDVKTITLALSKAKGPEVTKAILAKFDVASAKQLVAGQWGDYIAACNKALA